MRRTAIRQYEMFVRVRDFGEAHHDLFPESSGAAEALAAIAKAVAQVSEHAVTMQSTIRGGTAAKKTAREALEDRLAAIGRTARVIADKTPGFDEPFRRPHRRQLDQTLLTSGRVAVRGAEQCASQFVARGMPPTFVGELRELVDRFEEAIRGRESVKARRAGSNAAVAGALASGFAALRTLDVILDNQRDVDPMTLAVWRRARRVDYHRRAKTATDAPLSVRVVSASALPEPRALPMPNDSMTELSSRRGLRGFDERRLR
jgi:hypothetical protein